MTQSQITSKASRHPAVVQLIVNFIVLLILLAATIWLAHLDLYPYNGLIAMTIAVIKTLLVVMIFMHLKFSSKITWTFAAAGIVWLAIFFTLILSDYVSRAWDPRTDNVSKNIEIIAPPPGLVPGHVEPVHPIK